ALSTLDGLGQLSPGAVVKALSDEHAGVRRHAVRLAEQWAAKSPDVASALVKLVEDSDAQVQLQLAYSLGEWNDPAATRALAALAIKHQQDAYLSIAVFS